MQRPRTRQPRCRPGAPPTVNLESEPSSGRTHSRSRAWNTAARAPQASSSWRPAA
jgi:hypothetical protein